jgi:uncharacterized protein
VAGCRFTIHHPQEVPVAIKIEETFQVQAPAARVWDFLIDPAQVVQCLPGAELLEAEDEKTFVGRVKVKVGPVTASYKGRASFVDRDDTNRRIRMEGSGQETGGSGSAKMTMSSEVVELADGSSEVRVHAELDVVGRIVQFGRGMIEEVNRQLFRQFAECTRARLAEPAAEPAAATAGGEAGGAEIAATAASPDLATPARAAPIATAPGKAAGPAQPVRAIPLFFRALWAMIKRFVARLFGRG